MTRLAALKARLGGGESLPVDITSPYFAHMRLQESGKARDVLVGKRGFIDRESNVQIVDWRNAPISRIYYRYEEGDDYEEEIAGRRVEGVVEARRNVSIAQGQPAPHRRAAGHVPQGRARRLGPGGRPDRAGAARRHGQGGAPGRRRRAPKGKLGIHHGVARADKALPEIAALIDKEQFELITQPRQRHRRDPGRRRLGQDHGRAAPRRVPELPGPAPVQGAEHAVRRAVAGARALRRRRAARRSASPACRS